MARDLIVDGELVLYGPVGGDWWDDTGFTALDVRLAVAQMSGDITVRLNSGGGLVEHGMAIHNILAMRKAKGKVTIHVDGMAASMASIIAMAGDEIIMGKGALMMIHNASTVSWGNAAELKKAVAALTAIDGEMVDIYADQTGESPDDIREMMEQETWLGGAEAVEKGFATAVAASGKAAKATAFDYRVYASAPKHLTAMALRRGWDHSKAVAALEARPHRFPTPSAATAASLEASMPDTKQAAPEAANDNAKAVAEAAKAATARIAGILDHAEAKGRETLAKHFAFETDLSVEAAGKALAAAEKAGGEGAGTEESPQAHAQRRAAAGGLTDPASAPKKSAAKGDLSILAGSVARANKRR